ncbi:MAG: ABC transporter permease [candidate division Zixibacteria bacterium]|jgi:ABC-type antimicrobial peptide transport system permease subunit|nr:ABC transporter permease [candidate division Zixibacteria bacterium]
MRLLAAYSFRNVIARRLTSTLTIIGVALVVFVFCAVLMLSHGLRQTLVDTGFDDNAIIIRKASQTEIQSILPRDMANVVRADPAIAPAPDGGPFASGELMVLINQPKRGSNDPSNVPIRGVSPNSMTIRPNIGLVEGRMWKPGTSEIIAGAKVARNFQGCGLGESVRFASRDWTVVGVFETDGSGFESELWGDYEQLAQAFQRPIFSSITVRVPGEAKFAALRERLENDPRVTVDVKREKEYYAEQSNFTRTYINVLGLIISVIFAAGATVGAMITMYASVAGRTTEIGTLRALGFSRFTVLLTFLVESIFMGLIGGSFGVLAATFLRQFEVSTTNWDTFAELAFGFETSWGIVVGGFCFAVAMGVVGGFLPALQASQVRIIEALRAK